MQVDEKLLIERRENEIRFALRNYFHITKERIELAQRGEHIKSGFYPDSFAAFRAHEAKRQREVLRQPERALASNPDPVKAAFAKAKLTRSDIHAPTTPYETYKFPPPKEKKKLVKETKMQFPQLEKWFSALRGRRDDPVRHQPLPAGFATREHAWTWLLQQGHESKSSSSSSSSSSFSSSSSSSAPEPSPTFVFRLLQVIEHESRLWLEGVTASGFTVAVELLDFTPFFFVVRQRNALSLYDHQALLAQEPSVEEVKDFESAVQRKLVQSKRGNQQPTVQAKAERFGRQWAIRLTFSSWDAMRTARQAIALDEIAGFAQRYAMRHHEMPQTQMLFCLTKMTYFCDLEVPARPDEGGWIRPSSHTALEQALADMDAGGETYVPPQKSTNLDDRLHGDPSGRTPRMALHLVGRLSYNKLITHLKPKITDPVPIVQAVFDIETVSKAALLHQLKFAHDLPLPHGDDGETFALRPGDGPRKKPYSLPENAALRKQVEKAIAEALGPDAKANANQKPKEKQEQKEGKKRPNAANTNANNKANAGGRSAAQRILASEIETLEKLRPLANMLSYEELFHFTESLLLQGAYDKKQQEAKSKEKQVSSFLDPHTGQPRVLGTFPNASRESDMVVIIATHLQCIGDPKPFARILHVLDDGTTPIREGDFQNVWLVRFRHEADLLDHWTRLLWDWNIMWLTGFNSIAYDLPYVAKRLSKLEMRSAIRRLSRVYEWPWDAAGHAGDKKRFSAHLPRIKKSGPKGRQRELVETPALIQCDELVLVRSLWPSLDEYKLKSLAKHFDLKVNKMDVPGDLISPYYAAGGIYRWILWAYCDRDVEVTTELQLKVAPVNNLIELAALSSTSIQQQMLQGQGIKITNMTMLYAYQNGILWDDDRRMDFQALAHESLATNPIPAFLENYVWNTYGGDVIGRMALQRILPDLYVRKTGSRHTEISVQKEGAWAAEENAKSTALPEVHAEEEAEEDDGDGDGDGDGAGSADGEEEEVKAKSRDKFYQGAIVQNPEVGIHKERVRELASFPSSSSSSSSSEAKTEAEAEAEAEAKSSLLRRSEADARHDDWIEHEAYLLIAVVDYASLYPNLLRSSNLCPTTIRHVRYGYIGGFRCKCRLLQSVLVPALRGIMHYQTARKSTADSYSCYARATNTSTLTSASAITPGWLIEHLTSFLALSREARTCFQRLERVQYSSLLTHLPILRDVESLLLTMSLPSSASSSSSSTNRDDGEVQQAVREHAATVAQRLMRWFDKWPTLGERDLPDAWVADCTLPQAEQLSLLLEQAGLLSLEEAKTRSDNHWPARSSCPCFDASKVTLWFPEYESDPATSPHWTPAFDKYYLWDRHDPVPPTDKVGDRELICVIEIPAEGKFPARTFAFVQNRGSLFPALLTRLLDLRAAVRKDQKKFQEGTPEYDVLDARQAAVKVVCNSAYGVLGARFGKVGCMPVAMSITACGRIDITETRRVAEKVYGYRCIYGDTDSLFLVFPGVYETLDGKPLEFLQELTEMFAKEMTEHRLPTPMKLEFEKVLSRFTLLAKKKYWGIYMNTDKAGKMIGKGLEHVRRDFCGWSRKVLEAVLKNSLDPKKRSTPSELLKPLVFALQRIVRGQVAIEELQRTVSKKAGINPSTPQATVFRMLAEEGKKIEEGTRVPFVFVMPEDRGFMKHDKAYEFARPVEWVIRRPDIRLNRQFYINTQLRDPLMRMLQYDTQAVKDVERLCGVAGDMVWRQDAGVRKLESYFSHRGNVREEREEKQEEKKEQEQEQERPAATKTSLAIAQTKPVKKATATATTGPRQRTLFDMMAKK
jgi:DNA polymerase elongation subunit (family B)